MTLLPFADRIRDAKTREEARAAKWSARCADQSPRRAQLQLLDRKIRVTRRSGLRKRRRSDSDPHFRGRGNSLRLLVVSLGARNAANSSHCDRNVMAAMKGREGRPPFHPVSCCLFLLSECTPAGRYTPALRRRLEGVSGSLNSPPVLRAALPGRRRRAATTCFRLRAFRAKDSRGRRNLQARPEKRVLQARLWQLHYVSGDLNAAREMIMARQQHGERGMQDRGNTSPGSILMVNYKEALYKSARKTGSQAERASAANLSLK